MVQRLFSQSARWKFGVAAIDSAPVRGFTTKRHATHVSASNPNSINATPHHFGLMDDRVGTRVRFTFSANAVQSISPAVDCAVEANRDSHSCSSSPRNRQ